MNERIDDEIREMIKTKTKQSEKFFDDIHAAINSMSRKGFSDDLIHTWAINTTNKWIECNYQGYQVEFLIDDIFKINQKKELTTYIKLDGRTKIFPLGD